MSVNWIQQLPELCICKVTKKRNYELCDKKYTYHYIKVLCIQRLYKHPNISFSILALPIINCIQLI